jgi:hypothetical protein
MLKVIAELEKSINAIAQDNALIYSKKPNKVKDHARKDAVLGLFRKGLLSSITCGVSEHLQCPLQLLQKNHPSA